MHLIQLICIAVNRNQGLVLSTKILRSVKNFKPAIFLQKGQKNYLTGVLAWLAY
jgi:hypothetical protein